MTKLAPHYTGYCDMNMIADWKLEAMTKMLFEQLWGERWEAVQLACQMLRDCVCDEPAEQGGLKRGVLSQIAKAEKKIENLIEMRAEGEISKEEFLRQRAKLDGELKALQAELQAAPEDAPRKTEGLAWKAIEDTLNQLIDFSGPTLDKKLYEKFVSKVIPRNNNRFAWIMNLDNGVTAEYTLVTEGRKASQKVSLADPEGDNPSLHQIGVIYLADFIKWREEQKNSPGPFPLRRRSRPSNDLLNKTARHPCDDGPCFWSPTFSSLSPGTPSCRTPYSPPALRPDTAQSPRPRAARRRQWANSLRAAPSNPPGK